MRSTVVAVPVQALGLLFLLLFATALAAAPAGEPAGRVVIAVGAVTAEAPDGTSRRLRRRDPVYSGDTLSTGASGRAQIRFTDRALVSLRPDTEFEVQAYSYNPATPASASSRLRLARGALATRTGDIARRNRASYRLSTPLAVIGVRGTSYEALHTPGGETLLGVNDGGITAETLTGQQADIGPDTGFPFARVGTDGTLQLLAQRPAALQVRATPDLDEQGDEDSDGDDDSGDGGDGDGGSGSDDGGDESGGDGGDGDAEDTAGFADSGSGDADSGDTAALAEVAVAVASEVSGVDVDAGVNPAEVGAIEIDDLVEGTVSVGLIGIAAGVREDAQSNGDIFGGSTVIGPDGAPVITADVADAPGSVLSIGGASLTSVQDNVAGVDGLQFGTFSPGETPAQQALLTFVDGTTLAQPAPILYVLGPAPDLADLTLDASFRLVAVNATGNTDQGAVLSVSRAIGGFTATLDLGSGSIGNGFADFELDDAAGSEVFFDFTGSVQDGIVNLDIFELELENDTDFVFGDANAGGAFIGTGEAFGAAFDFRFDNGWNLYGNLVATPDNNLQGPTAAEASALAAPTAFGFAFEDGSALPIRATAASGSGGDILFGTNDIDFVSDPGYAGTDFDFYGRLGSASVTLLTDPTNMPGTAGALFAWDGTSAPYTLIDAVSGLGFDFGDPLLFGLATPADIADLTGFQFFVSSRAAGSGSQGAIEIPTFTEESLGQNSLGLVELVTASFAVDFASGVVSDGLLVVDLAQNIGTDIEPEFQVQHQFALFFDGQTVSRGGMLHADLFSSRTVYDGQDVPGFSELGGVFTSGAPASADVGTGAGFLGHYFISADTANGPVEAFGVYTAEGRLDARIPDAARFAEFDRIGVLQRTRSPRIGPATAPGPDGPEILANLNFFDDGPAGSTFSTIPKTFRLLPDLLYSGNGNTTDVLSAVGGVGSSVDWGRWDTGFDGVNPAPFRQPFTDALGQTSDSAFSSFWATLLPADVATLVGVHTYSGSDVLGRAVDIDMSNELLLFMSASFDVDFGSGVVSNGSFSAGNSDISVTASFEGQVFSGILDGTVTGGSFTNNITASVFGLTDSSVIDGVFAVNDEFVGGFFFEADDPMAAANQADYMEGVMLLRRDPGIP